MENVVETIYDYAIGMHLEGSVATAAVVSAWAVVKTRQGAKKTILGNAAIGALVHSFVYLVYLGVFLSAFSNGKRVPDEMLNLENWYIHLAAFVAVSYAPQDVMYQLLTNEWVWPVVELIVRLNTLRQVNDAMSGGGKSLPLYQLFSGFLVFYGPALVRGDSSGVKDETLMAAAAYIVPQIVFELYLGAYAEHREHHNKVLLAVQIFGVLSPTNYVPFADNTLGQYVHGLLDVVTKVMPPQNDGSAKKTSSSGRPVRAATRRAASPAARK